MSTFDERGAGSRWRDEKTGRWVVGPPVEEEAPPERGWTPETYADFLEATYEPEFEIEVELRELYSD